MGKTEPEMAENAIRNFEAFLTACIFDVELGEAYVGFQENKVDIGELKSRMRDIASGMKLVNFADINEFITNLDEDQLETTAQVLRGIAEAANGSESGIGP